MALICKDAALLHDLKCRRPHQSPPSCFNALRGNPRMPGYRTGLFNALFFGGMGRVSLKCHTPTQTAL